MRGDESEQPVDDMRDAGIFGSGDGRWVSALAYATGKHAGHRRKGTEIPYLSHLLQVAGLVLENGGDEEEAIAALLHDVVEDRGATPDELRSLFGDRVTEIVLACSDREPGAEEEPWLKRKRRYLDHLRTASESVLRVSLADKLHNARAIVLDYRSHGEKLWCRFNPDADQLWYYRSLSNIFLDRAQGPFAAELERVVTELEHVTIAGALRRLVELGRQGTYEAQFVSLEPEDVPYYVQFAVDEPGLFMEAVHNTYQSADSRLTGDDAAPLLALGFRPPAIESQNFWMVLEPQSETDFAGLAALVRQTLTEGYGLDRRWPLRIRTSWRPSPDEGASSNE